MVVNNHVGHTNGIRAPYSVLDGSRKATNFLRQVAGDQIPPEFAQHLEDVTLTTATDGTQIYFPCPFKETEATVALKSVEASAVAALAHLRFPFPTSYTTYSNLPRHRLTPGTSDFISQIVCQLI